jgi:hypothetical protein
MKKIFTLAFIFLMGVSSMIGQQRYIDQLFSDVEVSKDVLYGVNASVLPVPVTGEAIPVPLLMDVYEPAGDTLEERPLVIYFHTGNFLPHPDNGSPTGTKTDSAVVEIATRLAKMGYVVAAAEYRKGWNPLSDDQDIRKFTLINAAYRGVQDCRTAIKFFRRNHAEFGNMYGIDPGKVVVWGQGTGGYISLNAMALDEYIEIPQTPGGKFIFEIGGNPVPMVIEAVNGDINCDSVGIVPQGYPSLPAGDTLNYPNHVGYSGDFNMAVNMGGALGDTSWMDPGQPAVVSYHVPTDPFAPYMVGLVIVPNLNTSVVEVFGSYVVQEFSNRMNNNDAFADMSYDGDFSATANSRNDGLDGLFPLFGSIPDNSAPWDWWSPDNENHQSGLQTNPDMSAMKARGYIDTIMAYYAPRACEVLGLDCALTNVNQVPAKEYLTVSPVPANNYLRIESKSGEQIQTVHIYDMQGRLLQTKESEHSNVVEMNRNDLPSGQYILRVFFKDAVASQFIQFH